MTAFPGKSFCGIIAFCVLASAAAAQTPAPATRADANNSQAAIAAANEYQRYCAVCHGLDGRGSGPVADAMQKNAADLTLIARRRGGHFPFSLVADTIRDGGPVVEHKAKGMLPWGEVFKSEGGPVYASALIFELTRYLEQLQKK